MNERYLTILEVSQKQAYIFQNNELRSNVLNSADIAWITSGEYLEQTKLAGCQMLHTERKVSV